MTLLENWAQLVACHEHPINKIVVHEPGAMARGIYRFSATDTDLSGQQKVRLRCAMQENQQ